jgi:hypothetical protein
MKKVLLKKESGGFAYSAFEKVIKLEIRPTKNGWFFEERAGTKGGTLTDMPTVTVADEGAAIAMLNERAAKAVADGYTES